ncbi:MAG: MFS transporter [Burkholderiales bacterium]|jgi:RhtX/FptX family siderophore transporter|nr:MFS transporter [Burkholderiales bacterium]
MRNYKTLASITALAIANTTPLYFATVALPTIMRTNGVSLTIIGLFGSLMLPWAFKFLWAPLLDRYYSVKFGKRKSWLIPLQILMLICLIIIYNISPNQHAELLFGIIIALLICAATHYLATSAFILEQVNSDQLRFGNYAQVVGIALGSFTGGGLFLIAYPQLGWQNSVLTLVIVNLILLVIQSLVQERAAQIEENKENRPSLISFLKRKNTRNLLYLCLIYRGCEGLVMGMQQPFLVDKQIAISLIGKVLGISGLSLSLFASLLVSIFLSNNRENIWLLILGIMRSICYLALAALAYFAISSQAWIFGVVVTNMACRSMEMVVLYTFFMQNCELKQSATDISILLCAEIIIYSAGMMLSGYLAKLLGYSGLFAIGSMLSLISTAICAYIIYKIIKRNQYLL